VTAAPIPLADKVSLLNGALDAAAIPYAFGGALALAYYAEPRATIDIDVNVFIAPDAIQPLVSVLEELGVGLSGADRRVIRRDGQIRLPWDRTPLDLFFAYDDFHFNAARRIRRVPFGEITIPILAAEDLLVCKAVFDRRKDWIDIDQILLLTSGSVRVDDVRNWLVAIVGADDARVNRFDAAVNEVLGPQSA